MSDPVISDVRLSLTGPDTLPLAVVLRGDPAYDPARGFFTIALKNESAGTKNIPFDEIRRNVVLVYRDTATGAEVVDNQTPPPKRDGSVETLAAGETKTFQVAFDYPEEIATANDGVRVLQFCVRWDSSWLRASYYTPGSYDWNESFELCREIRILDE